MDSSTRFTLFSTCFTLILTVLFVLPATSQAQPITVMVNGQPVKDGGTFYTPMGKKGSGNKVALFSKSDANYGINNNSGEPVTINDISVEHAKGVQTEEFELYNTDLDPKPLNVDKQTVKADGSYDFMLRFYPVRSGERKATVTVTYNGDKTYQWDVIGTGRNNASFFSHGNVEFSKLLGTPDADEMPTAMVADENGNMFFSGQGTMVVDSFNNDIYLGRVNADGSLGWSWIWNSDEDDRSIDPGQNGVTGGSAEAMARDSDGNIYLAGTWDNAALVLKVNPETGQPIWEKYWMAGWPSYDGGSHTSSDFADAYSVDVQGNNVYVTGTTQNSVLLLSLNRENGQIQWQKKLDLHDGYKDRGYAVKTDGQGNLYLAGSGNNDGFLAKLSIANNSPEFLWAKQIQLGTGGNVNSIDFDASGNVYLSCDRRGAKTFLSVVKVTSDGSLAWGKTWEASNTDSNNSHVVRVLDGTVYFGGRIGIPTFDTQFGDAALLKLNTEDGSPVWRSFYYTGKGPQEMTEHRIKGIAKSGDSLLLYSQAYTSSYNKVRFWGYWYDGIGALKDYEPTVKPINVDTEKFFVNLEDGKVKDASGNRNYVEGSKHFDYQNAQIKYEGESNNADLMFWKLNTTK